MVHRCLPERHVRRTSTRVSDEAAQLTFTSERWFSTYRAAVIASTSMRSRICGHAGWSGVLDTDDDARAGHGSRVLAA